MPLSRFGLAATFLAACAVLPSSRSGAMRIHSVEAGDVCQDVTDLERSAGPDHNEAVRGPWLAGVLAGGYAEAMSRKLADYRVTPPGFGPHEQWLAFVAYCKAHPMATQLNAATAVWEQVRERGRRQ